MKKSRFSEEQIIGALREAGGASRVKAVCAKRNISEATFYAWKRKYGGMDVSEARRARALEEENGRLKRLVADQAVQIQILKEVNAKKMVSPSTRRRAAKTSVQEGVGSAAAACRALGLARASFCRTGRQSERSRVTRAEVIELSQRHPRYGYRRIAALLRRSGQTVNAKRVARLRRQEGLQVGRRQRRTRRVGASSAQRQRAELARHVWSWDFVEDQTENGSRLRILTLIDEHTRQSLAMHVNWSIRAVDVLTVLEAAIARYGAPEHVRSDNGPEFIAYAIQDWLKAAGIKTLSIKPGSPWENGHIESFHDKLGDECLKRELFGSLAEARVIVEAWRVEYNEQRPHSSLGYQTPAEFAAADASNHGLQSPSGLLATKVATTEKTNYYTTNQPAELQL